MGYFRTNVHGYRFQIKKSVFSNVVEKYLGKEMTGWDKGFLHHEDDEIICVDRWPDENEELTNIFAHVDGCLVPLLKLIEEIAPHVIGCGFIEVEWSHTGDLGRRYCDLWIFEENINKPIGFRRQYGDYGMCNEVKTNIKEIIEDVNSDD